jgi:hypothetical protein
VFYYLTPFPLLDIETHYWTLRSLDRSSFFARDGTRAPKKAAAANVETVFSGVGKFTSEAPSTGPVLLRRLARLHYNWKYPFLRPTTDAVVTRYKKKFGDTAPAEPALADAPAPAPAPPPAPAPAPSEE